jgi:hypothetical protein
MRRRKRREDIAAGEHQGSDAGGPERLGLLRPAGQIDMRRAGRGQRFCSLGRLALVDRIRSAQAGEPRAG